MTQNHLLHTLGGIKQVKKFVGISCIGLWSMFPGLRAQEIRPLSADSAYGVVRVSVCNLRSEGRFMADMSTQALLGMPVKVKQYNGWFEIQTPDEYVGWVHRLVITPMTHEQLRAWNRAEKVVITAHYGQTYAAPHSKAAVVSDVVGGNRLKWEGSKGRYYKVSYPDGRVAYVSKRLAKRESEWRKNLKQDAESIVQTACSLTGIPYLWAGTSSKGVDCSGLVRTALFMHDVIAPRDASQQAQVGERLSVANDCALLQRGDLLFFGRPATADKPESVSHVGVYLGNKKFIHSLGDVHINSLDPSDTDYDAFNAGRLLYAGRILPYINKVKEINTTATNPFYQD